MGSPCSPFCKVQFQSSANVSQLHPHLDLKGIAPFFLRAQTKQPQALPPIQTPPTRSHQPELSLLPPKASSADWRANNLLHSKVESGAPLLCTFPVQSASPGLEKQRNFLRAASPHCSPPAKPCLKLINKIYQPRLRITHHHHPASCKPEGEEGRKTAAERTLSGAGGRRAEEQQHRTGVWGPAATAVLLTLQTAQRLWSQAGLGHPEPCRWALTVPPFLPAGTGFVLAWGQTSFAPLHPQHEQRTDRQGSRG